GRAPFLVAASLSLVLAACAGGATPSPTTTAAPSASPTPAGTPAAPSAVAMPAPTPSAPPAISFPPPGTPEPCRPGDLRCAPYGALAERGIPYTPTIDCGGGTTCRLLLDLYHPAPGGGGSAGGDPSPVPPPGGWPIVVAIPGGPAAPGIREGLGTFAARLAAQGAVVAIADIRETPEYGGGYPATFGDVACAIRTARELGVAYGGDPSSVTLVGHSLGGWATSVVALSPRSWPVDGLSCSRSDGSPVPDRLVAVGAVTNLAQVGEGILIPFFGGTRDEEPAAWAAGDPVAVAGDAAARRIPVSIVLGEFDGVSTATTIAPFVDALTRRSRPPAVVVAPGADHTTVLESATLLEAILGRPPRLVGG
ncbi:MAG: hypothetical protein RL338_526, partial [Chloroflexota bacterium]